MGQIFDIFRRVVMNLEKVAACCACTSLITCIMTTLLITLGMGVGLGYNYCFVELRTISLVQKPGLRSVYSKSVKLVDSIGDVTEDDISNYPSTNDAPKLNLPSIMYPSTNLPTSKPSNDKTNEKQNDNVLSRLVYHYPHRDSPKEVKKALSLDVDLIPHYATEGQGRIHNTLAPESSSRDLTQLTGYPYKYLVEHLNKMAAGTPSDEQLMEYINYRESGKTAIESSTTRLEQSPESVKYI